MAEFKGIAGLVLASLMLAAPVAAQQATQVALIEGDAPRDYRAAGAVTAEVQSASNTLPKAKLDEQLRAEGAKLGADAIIQVAYQMTPATAGVIYKASGVAIRYAREAGVVAAPVAPVEVPVPAPAVPVAVAPAVAVPAPAVPVVVAPAVPVAVAVVTHAASAAQVELNEGPMQGRQFVRLGPVSATTHQKSLFPKVSPRTQLEEALRAEAFKMGADAVIEVKYDMNNAAFSKKGNMASGIAVKFE